MEKRLPNAMGARRHTPAVAGHMPWGHGGGTPVRTMRRSSHTGGNTAVGRFTPVPLSVGASSLMACVRLLLNNPAY
ncbi:hypothetical protein GCM10009548_31180 [Streptomyces malaysiensis subsp. malaysiensis]